MKLSENTRVIVGCLLGGLVGGMAVATSWTFEPKKDAWDIATAFGTLAAAAIALGIALQDGLRRAKTDRNKAIIVASRVAVKLDSIIDKAGWIGILLEQMPREIEDRSIWFDNIVIHAESDLPDIPIDDLAALEVLSHDCGQLIAKGMATFDLVRGDIAKSRLLFGKNDVPTASLVNLANVWRGRVVRSLDSLNEANRVCRRFGR